MTPRPVMAVGGLFLCVALFAGTSTCRAAGSAPVKIRNGTAQDIWVTVDNTGRGLPPKDPNLKTQDERGGTLVKPGAQVVASDTNLGDVPTIYVYDKNGNTLKSQRFGLVPLGGTKWERRWNGADLVDDD